jgi:hypothetical protein
MSDHESEVNPAGPEGEPGVTGSFSSNGSDPGASAVEGEGMANWDGDVASFMADLSRAMQTTAAAEQARDAEGTEQRTQAHIDAIRAREALEAEDLRELAKEDVKGIDAWSDGELKRVKLERERRIAARREQLQVRLEEHRAVVAREVEAVESAVAVYRAEIERFFIRLEFETDPIEIARQAGSRPHFPALELIGPYEEPVSAEYHAAPSAPAPVYPFPVPVSIPVTVPVLTSVDVEPETHDEGGGGPTAASPMIGVMAAEESSQSTDTAWVPEVEADVEPAAQEPSMVEASAVADESSAADEAAAPHESAASDGLEEPVPVVAEARVVMPRSTGAGSWLRWPNNSVDHTDTIR